MRSYSILYRGANKDQYSYRPGFWAVESRKQDEPGYDLRNPDDLKRVVANEEARAENDERWFNAADLLYSSPL